MPDAPFEAPSIESIARLLPSYQFEILIAQGGMGAVYKARQVSLDRDVAIKVLPHEMSSDPEFRKSFRAEARAMAKLIHPNLIGVFDTGDVDGLLYIVMELVPGKSLYHSCYGKVIDPNQAVDIVIGICSGLAHAHENGIIHRDIKPSNILLTPKAEPKIGDFGLAGAPGPDSNGLVMGTPGYTAPEILTNPDQIEKTSDIFSVGVVMRELLTGAPPESDLPSSPIKDPALVRICTRASNPNPAARYQDASEMEEELRKWRRAKGSNAMAAAAPAKLKVAAPAAGQAPPYTPTPPQTTHAGSTNWPLMRNLLIIIFLLGAIYLAWGVYQRKKEILAEQGSEEVDKPQKETNTTDGTTDRLDDGGSAATPSDEVTEAPGIREDDMADLERLRPSLRKGKRDEMPAGTIRDGDHLYFYVGSPMTWFDAHKFAAKYDAHLPFVTGPDDIERLTAHFEKSRSGNQDQAEFWFGARAFGKRWHAVDGSVWDHDPMPNGYGIFGAIRENGVLVAHDWKQRRPFFIQWDRSGANPTDLNEMLRNCAASQGGDTPIYPFGAVNRGDRWNLIIWRPTNHDEARELAELGGGRLMEASRPKDADWIQKQLDKNGARKGFWLGGIRQGDDWAWESGAPWTFSRWADGFPTGPGDRIAFAPGVGWRNEEPTERLHGLIIEWLPDSPESKPQSDPEMPVETVETVENATPPIIAELTEKAKILLQRLDADREKALKVNANDYAFKLATWVNRGKNAEEVTRRKIPAEALEADQRTNRIPDELPASLDEAFPEDLMELARFYLEKQKKVDSDFRNQASNIHRFFIKKLETAADEADEADEENRADEARILRAHVEASADFDTWLAPIGDFKAEQNEFPAFLLLTASYGTKDESADVAGRVRVLLENAAGPFFVNPETLGADPAPDQHKKLTIEFLAHGAYGTRSWHNGNEVKPQKLFKNLGITLEEPVLPE